MPSGAKLFCTAISFDFTTLINAFKNLSDHMNGLCSHCIPPLHLALRT